jgi:hypothetical protein
VRCRVGAVVRVGEAVTLPEGDAARLAAAVGREEPIEPAGEPSVAVDCPSPGPVHGYVSPVREGMGLRVRTALAAAARSRGLTTPHDEPLASVREQLAALTVEATTGTEARREVAETATETDRLREREARDRLERRRRLQDRAANLEREARAALVTQVREEYARAVGETDGQDPFGVAPAIAALGVVRVAAVTGPVVLDGGGRVGRAFAAAEPAAAWLEAPVIYIR